LSAYARENIAISPEAGRARKAAYAVAQSFESSQVLFGKKAAAISQLCELVNECSEEDWDGAGASSLNPLAVSTSELFLRALPDDLAFPELAPEPDGWISMDWIQSKSRLFSLSIDDSNRIAFAWLDGSDKGHGVARFDGRAIPSRILSEIREIVNYGNTFLRAV
jgi:hypothetical protein